MGKYANTKISDVKKLVRDDFESSIPMVSDENLQEIYYFPVGNAPKILGIGQKNPVTVSDCRLLLASIGSRWNSLDPVTGSILRNTASMK